jgi:NAD(P)-dependent dehydrogenase (short-subunit alcohol dehydrogenase family)
MYHGPDHRSHSGISKATALSLADRGAHVLVGGRDAACGDAVVAPIQAKGGKADFVAADLRSADSARSFARRAIELGGGHVDILVNNAAIFPMGPTPEIGEGGHRRRLRR